MELAQLTLLKCKWNGVTRSWAEFLQIPPSILLVLDPSTRACLTSSGPAEGTNWTPYLLKKLGIKSPPQNSSLMNTLIDYNTGR